MMSAKNTSPVHNLHLVSFSNKGKDKQKMYRYLKRGKENIDSNIPPKFSLPKTNRFTAGILRLGHIADMSRIS